MSGSSYFKVIESKCTQLNQESLGFPKCSKEYPAILTYQNLRAKYSRN